MVGKVWQEERLYAVAVGACGHTPRDVSLAIPKPVKLTMKISHNACLSNLESLQFPLPRQSLQSDFWGQAMVCVKL